MEENSIHVEEDETSRVSLDNTNWHVDMDNQNITPIACKIYQTQYSCQSIHIQHINVYVYDIYIYIYIYR